MAEWAPKRFWKEAAVTAVDGGHTVTLDARSVRTPAKAPLVVPSRALALAIAAEWDAQQDVVRPDTMPVTRTANSAIDKVTPQARAVADMLADYGGTDLLSYRAEGPDELVACTETTDRAIANMNQERFVRDCREPQYAQRRFLELDTVEIQRVHR